MKTLNRTLSGIAIGCLLFGTAGSTKTTDQKPRIEVCFVLDTTGSMGGLIEGAKQKIWAIANQMASARPRPELKVALVGFRDRGDEYVTRLSDLNDDIDAVYAKLQAFQAAGGGDTPESVNEALADAVRRISWSQDRQVLKIIFLVGDSPPHMDYQNSPKYPEVCQEAAKRDLIINTVQCGNYPATTPVWQEIARLAEGRYAALGQTGNMLAIATPVDGAIAELNREIGRTLVAYGDAHVRGEVVAKQAAAEAAPAAVAADRLVYNATAGKAVQGGGELLEALARGNVKLAEVRKDQLPAALQNLNVAELQAYVEKQQAIRTELQKKISELNVRRQACIDAEKKRLAACGKGDSFDELVARTIRAQAEKKGIEYEK